MQTKNGISLLTVISIGILSLPFATPSWSKTTPSENHRTKRNSPKEATPTWNSGTTDTESSRDPAQRNSEVSSETYRLMEQVGRNLQNTLDEANNR